MCRRYVHIGLCPNLPKQAILLAESKAITLSTVLHELFHVLGRYHEQSRTDRNLYVKVYQENIEKGDVGVYTYIPVTCSKSSSSLSLRHLFTYTFSLSFPLASIPSLTNQLHLHLHVHVAFHHVVGSSFLCHLM